MVRGRGLLLYTNARTGPGTLDEEVAMGKVLAVHRVSIPQVESEPWKYPCCIGEHVQEIANCNKTTSPQHVVRDDEHFFAVHVSEQFRHHQYQREPSWMTEYQGYLADFPLDTIVAPQRLCRVVTPAI